MCMKCTTTWQERETERFATGQYKPVPVQLAYPAEHFVHLSVTETETDTVAYTPSEQYGVADRQVRLKFGRYLKKTFNELSDVDIQARVTELRSLLAIENSPATLHFATDRETINTIFETEMCVCGGTYTSCMFGKFTGDIRPYHVYADSPDVAVAYVTVSGRGIVSRSVVSTKDKVWVRAYSVKGGEGETDSQTLVSLLEDAGYKEGDLQGNRLTKLSMDKIMLPYIDNGGMGVWDKGKYWLVCDEGEGDYQADSTDGTASRSGPTCEGCDCPEDECECIYCECCEERYRDGCDRCTICEFCDMCRRHGGCGCNICEDCNRLVEGSRHIRACACGRCGECNQLERDCECEKCGECGRLTDDCDCECEEETEEVVPVTVVVSPASPAIGPDEFEPVLTREEALHKLNRVYMYLITYPGRAWDTNNSVFNIMLAAYNRINSTEVEVTTV